jgi:hypothetical protein
VTKTTVWVFFLAVLAAPALSAAASSSVVTAPEPATGLLIATGIGAGIAALRRRRGK